MIKLGNLFIFFRQKKQHICEKLTGQRKLGSKLAKVLQGLFNKGFLTLHFITWDKIISQPSGAGRAPIAGRSISFI